MMCLMDITGDEDQGSLLLQMIMKEPTGDGDKGGWTATDRKCDRSSEERICIMCSDRNNSCDIDDK